MGRSVSTPRNAAVKVYLDYESEGEYDDHDLHQMQWEDFVECVTSVISKRYPSLCEADGWIDREDRIILRNSHGIVTVSEYCGCVAICLTPDDEYPNRNPEISRAWCEQVSRGFQETIEKSFPDWAMQKLGTMSNGESVFQKVTT